MPRHAAAIARHGAGQAVQFVGKSGSSSDRSRVMADTRAARDAYVGSLRSRWP
jgi:hypothetical protein